MLSGLRIQCSLELWYRLAATAPIQPLAWEPPYAAGATLKSKKKGRKEGRKERREGGIPRGENESEKAAECIILGQRGHAPGWLD